MSMYDFELLTKIDRCIYNNGTVQEFAEIENMIFPKKDSSVIRSGLFVNSNFSDISLCSVMNFLSAFAERFPDKFLKRRNKGNTVRESVILKAMIADIFAGRRSAETLAETILVPSEESEPFWKEALDAAISSKNESFFEYFLRKADKPIRFLCDEMYFYLSDSGRKDWIAKIMKGASREDILNIFRRYGMAESSNLMDSQKQMTAYIYELAEYIPEACSSEAHSHIVSELMEELNVPISIYEIMSLFFGSSKDPWEPTGVCDLNIVLSWEFMKEHNIRIRNLDRVLGYNAIFKVDRKRKPVILSVLKKYIVPILDEKVYLSESCFSSMDASQQGLTISFIDIIGADRVFLDCSDNFACGGDGTKLYSAALIKKGVSVIFNEDMKHSLFIERLLHNSSTLEYMLSNGSFTTEQIETLVEICIDKKLLKSLNVIRKYMSAHSTNTNF